MDFVRIGGTLRAILCLGLGILAGCGTSVERRYVDPSFDAAALGDGGLAVAAVVVAERPDLDDGASLSYARLLHQALRDRSPDRRLAPLDAFPTSVSGPDLARILDRYREAGSFTGAEWELLRSADPGPRYLAFARVESDQVDETSSEARLMATTEEGVTEGQTWTAKRTVVVTFDVVDPRAGNLVWTARIRREDANRRGRAHTVRDPVEDRSVPVGDAWGETPDAPDPPVRLELLRDLFDRFAAELPE